MADSNILILFGTVLGIIGSILLGIDALGATELLEGLKRDQKEGTRLTQIGFLSTINNLFVYITISMIGLIVGLIITKGNIVLSLMLAPLLYLVCKSIIKIFDILVRFVKALGPGHKRREEKTKGCLTVLGCLLHLIHWSVWVLPFSVIYLLSMLVRFSLDLPLRFLSEKIVVPFVKCLLERVDRIVTKEKFWRVRRSSLIGTVFLVFGFFYQFVGTLLLIKWTPAGR